MSPFMPLLMLPSALPGAGSPSPESRADYRIEASLSPESVLVTGRIGIDFMPAYPADTLWLHLYPNAYRDPSTSFAGDLATMGYYDFAGAPDDEYGWILLDGWTVDGCPVDVTVDETIGSLALGRTARPGDTLRLEGGFTVKVPAIWSRMGHDGDHYEMTQWYPKMCVLDSGGWHTSRYRSDGEFYSDFGDYRVTLTLPDSFATAATGSVDSVSYSPDSLFRTETWTASQVHDFAWAADPAFVLLEHNFIPPAGSGAPPVRVHVAVQECSADAWAEVGAWADSTLLYYGEWCGWYPYGDLWIVQSAMEGGMEYPQLVMIQSYDPPFVRYFEMVVMHEIGHQWFYGMLGNDEVDEAWLDEGINSFFEIRYFERRYGLSGNMTSLPGWVSGISDADFTSSSYVGMVASGEEVPVLSTSTEAAGGRYDYGALYYSKPALFVRMIQNQIGDGAFDAFLREYCDRFRFHHPRTGDFMAILEEVSGRSWQEEFDFWLGTTGSADVRVEWLDWSGDTTVVCVSGDIPQPVELDLAVGPPGGGISTRVALTPGEVSQVRIPGRWYRAEVDPWTRFPDRRPWNNSLPAAGTVRPMIAPMDQPSRFNTWLAPFPGYADGGWEAGIYGSTHSASNWAGGPLEVTGFLRLPVEGGRPGSWALALDRPLARSTTGSTGLSVGMSSMYGREEVSASVYRTFEGVYPSDPSGSVSAGASFESVSDNSMLDGSEYEEGCGAVLEASASSWDMGMSSYRNAWIALRGSPDWGGEPWIAVEAEGSVGLTALPGTPGTRVFAGCASEGTPLQHSYRPGGGLASYGALGWMLPPSGYLSPLEHYFVESGPAMPGYGESDLHGTIGIGIGETVSLSPLPVSVFADVGWIEDSFGDLSMPGMLANAGLSLRAAFVTAWFPAWVSDPPDGEDEWEMRWRFAFSLWGLASLLG